jgi:hypothetical protein
MNASPAYSLLAQVTSPTATGVSLWQYLQDVWEVVRLAFLPGVAAGLLIALVLLLAWKWRAHRRQRRISAITVDGEHGQLIVRPRAVRDIIVHSLDEFRFAYVRNVTAQNLGSELVVSVEVDIAPQTVLRVEKDRMQEKVIQDLIDLVGVKTPIRAAVIVLSAAAEKRNV